MLTYFGYPLRRGIACMSVSAYQAPVSRVPLSPFLYSFSHLLSPAHISWTLQALQGLRSPSPRREQRDVQPITQRPLAIDGPQPIGRAQNTAPAAVEDVVWGTLHTPNGGRALNR